MKSYPYNIVIQVLCAIHTLQLSVNDTLKSVKAFVRKSGPVTLALKTACEEVDIPFTTPKNPQETRWNSQHTNLMSVIKLKAALVQLVSEDPSGDWANRVLTAAEWKLAEGAVKVLEQPLLVTKAWEAETTPTMNLVISELYTMKVKPLQILESVVLFPAL